MKDRLVNYFAAGYPALAIRTCEERRVLGELLAAAEDSKVEKSVVVWNAVEGLQSMGRASLSGRQDPIEALESTTAKDIVFVFCDLHVFPLDQDPMLNRAVKEAINKCRESGSHIVFLGADFNPPATFARDVVVMDFELPDDETVGKILDGSLESISETGNAIELNEDEREAAVRAAMGMTTSEIENAFFLANVETGTIDPDVVYREKVQAIKRSGLLELIDPDPLGMGSVGGLDNLKEYTRQRQRAFTKAAREYGLPPPRGVLTVGTPGCGKSLAAKAVGSVLGIPTLKFDVGALFNSLVGESERRTREALALAEAVAPVVLWLDEINFSVSSIR